MIRVAGMVMILSGCAFCGLRACTQLHVRIAVLEELVHALALMERELSLNRTALPELLQQLAQSSRTEVRKMMETCMVKVEQGKSFTSAWTDGLAQSGIEQSARDILRPLGQILGSYDADGQGAAIVRVREELQDYLAHLREETRARKRVYTTLSVTMGGFLVLMLL